jgi:hypothetical protein
MTRTRRPNVCSHWQAIPGGFGHRRVLVRDGRDRLAKEKTMRHAIAGIVPTVALALWATAAAAAGFQMTPAVQAELDKQKTIVAAWAAHPAVVAAVAEQNRRGPIAGMDNAKWKVTRRSEPVVTAFQTSPAGQYLKAQLDENKAKFSEAFLNAALGEKVAFVEKTTSYIHKGQPKFDVPFTTSKPWQGAPEFDESSQTYAIQISVPVLADAKPIGVLVVGVNLSHLETIAKK